MSKLRVYNPEDVERWMKTDAAATLSITKKKGDSKTFNGVEFLDVALKDLDKNERNEFIMSIKDVEITSDMKVDTDKKEGKKNLSIATSVNKSGTYGRAIVLVDTEFKRQVQKLHDDNIVKLPKAGIVSMIQTHYSDNNPVADLRSKPKDDPNIYLKMDFSLYPEKYPHKFLRGTKKTIIYDASTAYVDENGVTKYKEATVNGAPIDDTNVHEFIKRGCRIIDGRVFFNANKSNFGTSMPQLINKMVVTPPSDEGFEDEAPRPVAKLTTEVAKLTVNETKNEAEVGEFIDQV